jgi:hypothetical protein
LLLGILTGLLITFSLRIYGFLAVPTCRVDADILVVEGWVPDYVVQAASKEFARGGYACVATSDLQNESGSKAGPDGSRALHADAQLESLGVPRRCILACPAPSASWNRTSGSARAVRDRLRERGIVPKGVNVVTIGPHARQTRLAYRRVMGKDVAVGIITVPHEGFDSTRWWASGLGIKWVSKDFAGWLKECLFGLRS